MSLNIPKGCEVHYAIRQPDGTLASDGLTGETVTFDDIAKAEQALASLNRFTARMGVTNYQAEVVWQLRTEFIGMSDAKAQKLVSDVEGWLKSQGGQG